MHASRECVAQCLRRGAQGYVVKDSAVDELADAIKAMRQGRPYISRLLANDLLSDYLRDSACEGAAPAEATAPTLLTPRQREVLQLLAEGRSMREIATRLNLSVNTIESHRAELMCRLDVHEIAGLTRYAIRHGMISAHD